MFQTASTMKSIYGFGLAALVFALALVGCSGGQGDPSSTAKLFLDAIASGDYDGAKEYCTEGTRESLNMYKTFSGLGANPMTGTYEVTREDINGDYAKVYYDKDGSEHFLNLRKDGNKWFVIANKADMGFGDEKEDEKEKAQKLEDIEDETPDPADTYKAERDGKSAKEIGEAFLVAYAYSDYDKAKHYASKSTAEVIDMQTGLETDENKKSTKVNITKVDEQGEYATVYYKDSKSKNEKELKLGKDKHGNWEVIMTKSDFSAWDEKSE